MVTQLSLKEKVYGIAEGILFFKKHKPVQLANANHSTNYSTTSKLLEAITLANALSLSEAKEALLIKGLLCSTPAHVIMSAQKIRRNKKQHAERRHERLSGMYWLKEFLLSWAHVAWLLHCHCPVSHFKNYSLIFKIENIF